MRPAIARIAWSLMIGAVLTVAVAWACAAWLPSPPLASFGPTSSVTAWPGPTPPTWPSQLELSPADGANPVLEVNAWSLGRSNYIVGCGEPGVEWYEYWVHTTGLPFRSMRFDFLSQDISPPTPNRTTGYPVVSVWRQGVKLVPSPAPFRLRMPLMPVWPGFVLSTIFYAMVVFVMHQAIRRGVVWRRTAAGACVACGYPIGPLTNCPECGRPAGPTGVPASPGPADLIS